MKTNFEDQVDAIRIALYEQTRNMSNDEAAQHTNDKARRIAAQFGIRIHRSVLAIGAENADRVSEEG